MPPSHHEALGEVAFASVGTSLSVSQYWPLCVEPEVISCRNVCRDPRVLLNSERGVLQLLCGERHPRIPHVDAVPVLVVPCIFSVLKVRE